MVSVKGVVTIIYGNVFAKYGRSSTGSTPPQGRTSASASKCGTTTPKTSCKSLEKYYEAYDPDYEAYPWIGPDGHGKNGAPYHIKDIVCDMEAAEAMIDMLLA